MLLLYKVIWNGIKNHKLNWETLKFKEFNKSK